MMGFSLYDGQARSSQYHPSHILLVADKWSMINSEILCRSFLDEGALPRHINAHKWGEFSQLSDYVIDMTELSRY